MGVWTSSMNGAPWTKNKMNTAVKQLRERALISYVIDVDDPQDLLELDQHVFAKRPDLVLSVSQVDMKGRYTKELLQTIAELQHITALQLNLNHSIDLSVLGTLERLQYLSITAKKPVDLSFLASFRQLHYLSVHGRFHDLTPIGDASSLDTLILRTTVHELEFVRRLPKLLCLFIHDSILKGSLDALADSTVPMLSLAAIRNLTGLDVLESMHNLIYLRLCLPKVEALCDFSNMPKLLQLELDQMKSLEVIDPLWSATQLEMLELREISAAVTAKELEPLTAMEHLKQVDFQYIDFNKGRITALREWFAKAGKSHILYENIAEAQRIKPMSLVHLRKHIGLNQ
ncbi:hypothetical protein MHH28_06300 [Paenibacillus sp. FSL K6-1217]|uniref:hypothetical protein n=1 Tax=Paenibacillus sp. FSL K6-1217 TaxID=2921466 RepID=UPI003244093D